MRDAARQLQEFPLDQVPSDKEWDKTTEELTKDDLETLKKLAEGHQERAAEAAREGEIPEAFEEAAAAILLWPKDHSWGLQTAAILKQVGPKSPEAELFFKQLSRRHGKKVQISIPRWFWPLVILLASVALGTVAMVLWHPGALGSGGLTRGLQGPRTLETTFDTQGVKTNIQVLQSRLLIFPETTVAELSAWVTFPEHRIELWEGTVSALDAQGQTLAHRDVTFRSSANGPLEAGQGIEVFQQFDAWPWFDRAASFQLTTTRILAKEAHPKDRKEWPVTGIETLTAGFNLKVWLEGSQWSDRFASKVHTLTLELENSGLKPFSELQFALVWRDGEKGRVLKTIQFRPVSAFRTALPPGGRLNWKQETVFNTEVFSWTPGAEPYPVLELVKWQ